MFLFPPPKGEGGAHLARRVGYAPATNPAKTACANETVGESHENVEFGSTLE
jgi:hypothetical protein